MARYRVWIIQHGTYIQNGSVEVEAETEEEASRIARELDDHEVDWEAPSFDPQEWEIDAVELIEEEETDA